MLSSITKKIGKHFPSSIQEKWFTNDTKQNQLVNYYEGDTNTINILLMGETGVGKSTFINSFVNYMSYMDFETAFNSKLECLIPTKFTIPDENYTDRVISIGQDKNEDDRLGQSSTQCPRSYIFKIQGDSRDIRLIDTPGIGDSRGIDQDKKNFDNILSYISKFKYLHGICFLLKPNVSVINAYFEFCIMHLISHLEKSASKNIIFLFTNSRSTFYRPGETLPNLRNILEKIKNRPPHVEIKCNKDNIFCLDNEAFKFLVALKNNIEFGERERVEFAESWRTSVLCSWKLLYYIMGNHEQLGLEPHEVQNTLSINHARTIIFDLCKPLSDINDLIEDNLIVLRRHNEDINQTTGSLEELKKLLFVPHINLKEIEIPQPVTVCTSNKCLDIHMVSGIKKFHYKQKCHNPCYLDDVPREMIGSPQLVYCRAMESKKCKKCGCDFSTHMHILYETEPYYEEIEDVSVKNNMKTKQDFIESKNEMVAKLRRLCCEHEKEKETISKAMATFAAFLQHNSISAYNDHYSNYIDYIIEREECSVNCDRNIMKRYQELKKQYQYETKILMEHIVKSDSFETVIKPQDITKCVQKLYQLPHNGKKIKDLHMIQQMVRTQNYTNAQEYRHKTPFNNNSVHAKTTRDNKNKVSAKDTPLLKSDGAKLDVKEEDGANSTTEEIVVNNLKVEDVNADEDVKVNDLDTTSNLTSELEPVQKSENSDCENAENENSGTESFEKINTDLDTTSNLTSELEPVQKSENSDCENAENENSGAESFEKINIDNDDKIFNDKVV